MELITEGEDALLEFGASVIEGGASGEGKRLMNFPSDHWVDGDIDNFSLASGGAEGGVIGVFDTETVGGVNT